MTTQCVAFTAAGSHSWVAPANISSIMVMLVGGGTGGGNGSGASGPGGGGGGGGEWIQRKLLAIVPGETVTVVVGAGGAGMVYGSTTWGAGGFSAVACTFGQFNALGGKATDSNGSSTTTNWGRNGGGVNGGVGSRAGLGADWGKLESPGAVGGAGGGGDAGGGGQVPPANAPGSPSIA